MNQPICLIVTLSEKHFKHFNPSPNNSGFFLVLFSFTVKETTAVL